MLGDLISAGVGLFTGLNKQKSEEKIAAQNIALQKEFAQSGIQWKVQDAIKAGIHPLAALGANTSSFSPVSVGGGDFGSMGQDLGRAVKAAMSMNDRASQDEAEARRLELENKGLQNDVLRAELASKIARSSSRSAMIGPPMPSNTSVLGRVPMPRPGPARSMSGHALEDDKMKIGEEGGMPFKSLPWYGMDVHLPNWLASGQQWEDVLGEYGGGLMGATSIPGIVGYNLYKRHGQWKYPWWRGRR